MKIDADSNGSVEWPEFMNYMLLENQTLALMKKELFEYIPSKKPDPKPTMKNLCHAKMITGLEFIYPDGFDRMSPEDQENQKKNIRYATSSQDGTIKIWDSQKLEPI